MLKKIHPIFYPFLSGILLFLSFPNNNLYYIAWISLIPLLYLIRWKSGLKVFMYGYIAGLIAYLASMQWLYVMIKFNTNSIYQSFLCWFLLSSYMALYLAFWLAGLWFVRHSTSVFRFSIFAAAYWVALEILRTYVLSGFPWLLLGYTQWKLLSVIQIAEYTGVYGVSFLIILVNVFIFQYARTKRWMPFSGLLLILVSIIIFGKVQLHVNYYSSPPYINVAVIQPNIDQYKKWDVKYEQEILSTISNLTIEASKDYPDVVIWPETAVPGYLPSNAYMFEWVSNLARQSNVFQLVGAPYYNGGTDYYNSVLQFSSEGEILNWHKKTHLVPFGEFVPFKSLLEPYFRILTTLGDFTKAKQLSPITVKSVIWGVTICSENFFGRISCDLVKKGAQVISNHTNDAWFFKSSAPYQHFVMNVFRAIETRRVIIVSGNTGISGVVEPSGMISKTLPIFEKGYFTARVAPQTKITFYAMYGNIFAKLCILITLLVIYPILRKKNQHKIGEQK